MAPQSGAWWGIKTAIGAGQVCGSWQSPVRGTETQGRFLVTQRDSGRGSREPEGLRSETWGLLGLWDRHTVGWSPPLRHREDFEGCFV